MEPNNEFFYWVKDPRQQGKIVHSLEDILRLALIATICFCDGPEEMADFVSDSIDDLKAHGLVGPECGCPSADTFSRVLCRIDPDQLNYCLQIHNRYILDLLEEKHIAIDGKKLRGTCPTYKSSERGLYILNAWATENNICVAQVPVKDKSNEKTAIPEILHAIDLTRSVVSIDAMGTQKDIAELIVARGAHYFLALKDNQRHLLTEVQDAFRLNAPTSEHESFDRGHGRKERRLCSILPVSALEKEPAYEGWPHLKTIVKIERTREIGNTATQETAYFLSDEDFPSARYYAMVARAHWGVENGLHWMLDVVFKEDDSRLRTGFGPRNLSTLRKLALDVLRRADDKLSLARRRKKCARNLGYLYTILNKSL